VQPLRRAAMVAAATAIWLSAVPLSSAAAARGGTGGPPADWPTPPSVAASAVVVMDAANGQVLYADHPTRPEAPASLAKIMTFDLALKAIRDGQVTPSTRFRIGLDAWHIALNPNYSRMFLQVGTEVPVGKLLLGLMVSSGDDAAVALADGLAGSQAAFVREMNREARILGLVHTHFANASGIGAPSQRTTAIDMALLTRHVIETYPDYRRYTDVEWFTWDHIQQQNFNRLIGVDKSVTGMKSGHLGGPNFHLVATAVRGGRTLIVALFGAPSLQASADEAETLLNWAFRSFKDVPVSSRAVPRTLPMYEGARGSVRLRLSRSLASVTVPSTWTGRVRTRVSVPDYLVAPVRAGAVVGQVTVLVDHLAVAQSSVVAEQGVPRGNVVAVVFGAIGLLLHRVLSHL
jgi:D-alanyl-D-alanine carboxypeptidase (penicillin-binding protein 5/6)